MLKTGTVVSIPEFARKHKPGNNLINSCQSVSLPKVHYFIIKEISFKEKKINKQARYVREIRAMSLMTLRSLERWSRGVHIRKRCI